MRDWLLMEKTGVEELDSETGEPGVLLELAEIVSMETVSVMTEVEVEVDRMIDALVLPVPASALEEFAGAVGKPGELLETPVLSVTPVLNITAELCVTSVPKEKEKENEGVGKG